MNARGEFLVDPECLEAGGSAHPIEVVIPYTGPETTAAALQRVSSLTAGLNAQVLLVAVHSLPLDSLARAHAELVQQLLELAECCALPVQVQAILAGEAEDGFRFALKPSSTVLIAIGRDLGSTPEERLASTLARDGHKVALLHIPYEESRKTGAAPLPHGRGSAGNETLHARPRASAGGCSGPAAVRRVTNLNR